jgi:hypothetical protein
MKVASFKSATEQNQGNQDLCSRLLVLPMLLLFECAHAHVNIALSVGPHFNAEKGLQRENNPLF